MSVRRAARRPWSERLAGALELPADVLLDVPRLTLLGDRQLRVENHRGLLLFRPEEILVGLSAGRVRIRGEELAIGLIHAAELTVQGRLRSVEFEP